MPSGILNTIIDFICETCLDVIGTTLNEFPSPNSGQKHSKQEWHHHKGRSINNGTPADMDTFNKEGWSTQEM
jgi:hypothetical protein